MLEPDHGQVSWRIRDGLLVARAGRGCGFLALDVRRRRQAQPTARPKLRIEVEVANFYPAIAAGFSMPVYEATQSSIHVLVTHAFLRSLATLELAESRVGRCAARMPLPETATPPRPHAERGLRRASAVAHAGQRPQLGAVVAGRDPPHGARPRAHHERLGGGAAAAW